MMFNGRRVSVVIPAYNEEKSISRVVKDFSKPFVDEIIVVDNNCTDRTAELAKKAGAKVIKQSKQGYGNAIQKGLSSAKGYYIFVVESDQTFRGKDMEKLLAYADDADMILGTRTCYETISTGANMNLFLQLGNVFIAKVIQLLYGNVRLTDVGCTFRLIKRSALMKIIKKFTVGGSHFSPEMIVEALKKDLKIIEIPVNYGPRTGIGKITSAGKWKSFKVGVNMLRMIVRKKFS